jgi:hypothetical protein
MLLKTHVGPDLHRRNCGGQVSHAHQIVGGASESKNSVHFAHSAMPHLPHQRNRLHPAEAFFDSLPLLLTEGVTRVPRGAAINRAAAGARIILCYMQRHPQIPALGCKSMRVESFVSAYRHRLRAGKFLQHHQRRIALRHPVGLEHFRVHLSRLNRGNGQHDCSSHMGRIVQSRSSVPFGCSRVRASGRCCFVVSRTFRNR